MGDCCRESSGSMRGRRHHDLAARAVGSRHAAVQGRKPAADHFGDSHVPSIVDGEAVTQLPDARRKRLERKELDIEAERGLVGAGGLEWSQHPTALKLP